MNEILTHSTMWVNPHDIMLSDSTAWFLLYEVTSLDL
jgi:hypothetical protein